jgi:3-hydroxyacyl-[acyl-carrier-protein] dehydratase
MSFEMHRTISHDHPSLPGHFAGAPVVPAVVILEEVLAVVNEWRADSRLVEIPAVKFLAPLRPGQLFTICLSCRKDEEGEIEFRCRVGDRVIVKGLLRIYRGSGKCA